MPLDINFTFDSDHEPEVEFVICAWCDNSIPEGDSVYYDGIGVLCLPCTDDLYRCVDCGDAEHRDDLFYSDNDDELRCRPCYRDHEDHYESEDVYDEFGGQETIDISVNEVESDDEEPQLWLPVLPNRDTRLVSFEQEIMGGSSQACLALYEAGVCVNDYVAGYHSGMETQNYAGRICYVEHDGSVDAEIIWSKLDLSSLDVAKQFEKGLRTVHQLVHTNVVDLSLSCGGHIHVDATGLEMRNIMSLYVIWNHLEDTMFRLASARWNRHRIDAGNDYSPLAPKGLKRHSDVYANMSHGRGALNLSNYLYARSSCHCGAAQTGVWSECTCELRQPTVEFRVWNTTANIRKVHAYTALSLAMVEWARQNTATVEEFPEHGYRGLERTDKDATDRAMKFVLEDLPLTHRERASVMYCARNSTVHQIMHS